MKIHHLGLVTTDVPGTLLALGLEQKDIVETVDDLNQKNRLHFIHLPDNDMWLELVEPLDDSSSVNNFARKNRVGLHHLAFGESDIAARRAALLQLPHVFPLRSYEIDVASFGGRIRTLFAVFHGLLIEYVQKLDGRNR